MKRIGLLRVCLVLLAAGGMLFVGIRCTGEPSPPNIIFILADDLGYGDLGVYGQKVISTPRLDAMAAQGIRFTQCYTGSTVCAPSRSVLMTGMHTGHTTVRGNTGNGGVLGQGGAPGRIPLNQNDTTVAEVLQSAGYVTGMIGKWGLGEPGTTGLPNGQGFDEFYGFLNQRRAHNYYPDYIWRDTQRVELEGNRDGGQGDYIHDLFTQNALNFLERHQDERFFLYLPYTIPHDLYQIPDLGIYADSTHWSRDEQVYAAMISRLDSDVGRILDQLEDLRIDENTIVFFCSDNGPASQWRGRFDSSGGLRGFKRDMYEGGIRTPMIVRYPGKIPAGEVDSTPWYFADMLPTLASIGKASCPQRVDGIDISPILRLNGTRQELPDRLMYWEFYERGFQQAVRWKSWKGLRQAPGFDWELYDLSRDEQERFNIAADHPARVRQIDSIAAVEHTSSPFFEVNISKDRQRTVFLIGDSTMKNHNEPGGIWGWGDLLAAFMDTTRIRVINKARGGRSSRTYITEGLWSDLRRELLPGDIVLIQFGHNDGGPLDTGRARGSLKGTGDETVEVIPVTTGEKETVHTYGWYLDNYINEIRSRGANPVIISMVPRNVWRDGKVVRADGDYGKWAAQVALANGAWFVDLNTIVAEQYEKAGPEHVGQTYFREDHTHTTRAGAEVNAASFVRGVRMQTDCPLYPYLVDISE